MFLLIAADSALAVNNYFWLVRITPNLRTLVQGLARVSIPEGATNSPAEMHYYPLSSNSLSSQTGTGPNPQVQSGWNIGNLMGLNWQALPQRRITSLGETSDSSYSSSLLSTQNYLPDMINLLFRPSPVKSFFDVFGSPFGTPIPFFTKPLNTKSLTDCIGYSLHSGVEILPESTNSQLIAPMTPVQPATIMGQIQGSQLASAINTAVIDQGTGESSFNPLISNLLSALAGEGSYSTNNMFFAPTLNSYLLVSPLTNSVLSLVPHETLIKLGLIPGADSEDSSHINPDTWGEKK